MANNRSIVTALFHVSNSSVFDSSNNGDVIDPNYIIEKFRVVFTVFGIALGISAIAFNAAIIIASVSKNALIPFSLQTVHLLVSLAVADLLLLLFGLPYDLVAANDGYWLEGSIGCQLSAYLPEASRFAWVGTVLLAMPLRWPSMMKMRKWAPAWTVLVWMLSLAVVIPYALRVDCLGLSETTGGAEPEAVGLLSAEHSCFCVFTVSQSEVVNMFGSSLLAFTLFPVIAIATIKWKKWTYETEAAPDIKWTTSPRRLSLMLFAFMACTLPRYVHVVVNYSEHAPTMDGHYGLAMSVMEIICCSLFYTSTLIHLMVSPHPRSLLRQFCRRPQQQNYMIENLNR